MPSEVSGMGHC